MRHSASDDLVALAIERYDLARSEDGDPFAVDRLGPNVAQTLRGGRASLRASLAASYAERFDKVPPAQALVDALAVLEGRALERPRQRLVLRTTRVGDESIVIDVGDEAGSAILVEPDGWRILGRSPVTFRRSELIAALPAPSAGSVSDLLDLLNIERRDAPLVLAYLVAALLGLPVPIMFLRGPAGSAKTSAARTLARTIDPSPAPVRSVPKDPESWAVTASGSYVVAIDNILTVQTWLCDALCRAVTGEGYLRRSLYTDSAISVIAFRRAIILTGIDPGAMRGDLADRLVAIDLSEISDQDRREDADVEAAFRKAHPAILAAILDLTASVLRTMPGIRMESRPRMADYGRVLATVDALLGTSGLDRYLAQRADLQREAADGDRVGSAVIAWMDIQPEWSGTSKQLLEAITPEPRPRDWPTTPRGLSGALRHVAQPLRAAGIRVSFARAGHERTRTIHLEHIRAQPSAPSAGYAGTLDRADDADRADGGNPVVPWRDVVAPTDGRGGLDSVDLLMAEPNLPHPDDWETV